MMAYSMGLMRFFNMSPKYMIVNPSYELLLIIQKHVLQLEYKIETCTQPTFQNIGHQFPKRYKWVLIQAM
jgi:hypothetical protein